MSKKRRSVFLNFSVNDYNIVDFFVGDAFAEAVHYYCRLEVCNRLLVDRHKTWEELESE